MTEQEKRDRILALAAQQVGTIEDRKFSNLVKYNTWFYDAEVYDGVDLKLKADKTKFYPWCGTSTSWIFHHAGLPLGVIDYRNGYAGCPFAVNNVAKWGRRVDPREVLPGDIFFIDFNKDGKWDHTGLVDTLELMHDHIELRTYEGNTSADEKGSQSNGGGYYYKRRDSRNSNIIFVRPNAYDREIILNV